MFPVVECCVFGEEAFAWWSVVRMSNVGENLGVVCWVEGRLGFRVQDDADAELVGGAFKAKGDHAVLSHEH